MHAEGHVSALSLHASSPNESDSVIILLMALGGY
jgi:hypothetical protein